VREFQEFSVLLYEESDEARGLLAGWRMF